MDQENIILFKNYDSSYTMVDLYLYDKVFGYKDSYNYYDIDADKKLLFKKGNNVYMKVVPLQLKINSLFGKYIHIQTIIE